MIRGLSLARRIRTRVPGVSAACSAIASSALGAWLKRRWCDSISKKSITRDVKKMPSPECCSGAVVSLPLASSRIASRGSCRSKRTLDLEEDAFALVGHHDFRVERVLAARSTCTSGEPEWSMALLIISVAA